MTRRGFIKGLLAVTLAGLFAAFYGFFIEPALRLRVRRWRVKRSDWPQNRPVKVAVLTDLHMAEPTTPLSRLEKIVARTNALGADLIVVLGDLTAGHSYVTKDVLVRETATVLGALSAPLGVYAILGNHDWWQDKAAQDRGRGPVETAVELERNGIPVLENKAIALPNGVWLAGLGDQIAIRHSRGVYSGVDDLPGTLEQIPQDAPAILLAHEPDIFPKVPSRVALTLCGHTHGGQVRLFGWSPVVPSRFGNRYAYGHVHEDGRDLVVSGGIGCSMLPVRFGVTPEITVIELSA